MDVLSARLSDTSLYGLPHPARVDAAMPNYDAMFKEVMGRDWPQVEKALRDEKMTLPAALRTYADGGQCPQFSQFMKQMGYAPSSTEQGAAFSILDYLRFKLLKRPHFVVDDALVELLEHTDIAEDIPVTYLTPPYAGLYLELGKNRQHALVLPNISTGDHILEGAYIEQGTHWDGTPSLHILLVGSPVGKDNALDDSTFSLHVTLAEPDRSLPEVLRESFERAHAHSKADGLRATPSSFYAPAQTALLMIAKVLLYINMPDVRRTVHAERSNAEKDLARVKATAKRAKAQRKLAKLYDYVLISSTATEKGAPGEGVPRTGAVRAHWRRGHLRMQPHGPQRSLRKLIHILPVLVGQPSADSVPPEYRIK